MAECSLILNDRLLVRAEGVVPEAEFALFDADCIDLETAGPGTTREMGYRTTAVEARLRLTAAGITVSRAREVARLLTEPARVGPSLVERYARGPVVRLVGRRMDAAELLEGQVYSPLLKAYLGRWLNLQQLSRDIQVPNATCILQSLHLALVLDDLPDEVTVVLTTGPAMAEQKSASVLGANLL